MENILDAIKMLQNGELEAAHQIAQDDPTELGSWLHGIVHMIEGDRFNSQYWYRRANRAFPGMKSSESEIEALATKVHSLL